MATTKAYEIGDFGVSLNVNSDGEVVSLDLDSDSITEGSTNLYYTNTRARGAISVSGNLTYDSSTGVLGFTMPTTIASLSNHDTDDLTEGSSNLYFTTARARASVSGSTGITYSSSTGAIALTSGIVTAGTYGDASNVAQVTVDTYGRVTSVSEVAIAGVDNVSYTASTGVLTVETSSGTDYSVDLGIGTGDSPTFQTLNLTANLDMGDNDHILLGIGDDLDIYHDASHSYIVNDTGTLFVQADTFSVQNNAGTSTRLTVTGSGTTVDGPLDVTTDSIRLDGGYNVEWGSGYNSGGPALWADAGLSKLRFAPQGNTSGIVFELTGSGSYINSDLRIGSTTAPTEALDITGNIAVSGTADVSSEILVGTNNSRLAENNLRFLSSGAAYIDHGTVGQPVIFRSSNASALDTNAFRINANGAVGIGTNTPYSSGLSVGTTDATAWISPGGQNNHLTLATTGAGGEIRFYTKGGTTGNRATTESMRIDTSGNVGIGTDPSYPLHVYSAGANPGMTLESDSTSGAWFRTKSGQSGAELFKMGTNTSGWHVFNDTDGEYRLTILNNGKVGIGTSSPTSQFQVSGGDLGSSVGTVRFTQTVATNSPTLIVQQTGEGGNNGNTQGVWIKVDGHNAGYGKALRVTGTNSNLNSGTDIEAFTVYNGGKVVVNGTNTSYGVFQVNQFSDNDESGIGILNSSAGRSMRLWCDSTYSYINSGDGGSGDLVLNQGTGNVGIGKTPGSGITLDVDGRARFTDTDDYQLTLLGSTSWAGIQFDDSGSNTDYLWFNGDNGTFSIGGGGANVSGKKLHVEGGTTIGAGLKTTSVSSNGLQVEGTTRLRGDVYFGATGTTYIDASATTSNVTTFKNDTTGCWLGVDAGNNTDDWYVGANSTGFAIYNSTDGRYDITADNTGNVGINDSTPSYRLDVNGDIRTTSDVIVDSDVRLKSDIKTITNAIDTVKALRGCSYIKDDKPQIGFIAQEMEEVMPFMVRTANDEMGTKSVNYQNMVALLVEGMKEQQKQIDELKRLLEAK